MSRKWAENRFSFIKTLWFCCFELLLFWHCNSEVVHVLSNNKNDRVLCLCNVITFVKCYLKPCRHCNSELTLVSMWFMLLPQRDQISFFLEFSAFFWWRDKTDQNSWVTKIIFNIIFQTLRSAWCWKMLWSVLCSVTCLVTWQQQIKSVTSDSLP